MNTKQKITRGLGLVWSTPGLRGKIATLGHLARVASRSRFGINAAKSSDKDIAADTWAEYSILRFVSRNINVRIDRSAKPRAWFVVPELNASVIFGGYIALFQFIKHVQSLGIDTGIIVLDNLATREQLLKDFEINDLAHEILSKSELQKIGFANTVRLGAKDMLVSYNWTASLVAARMARFLDDPSYYYFAQEDERIFYPNDSSRFLCESLFTGTPKPRLICNSAKLREHFYTQGLIDDSTVVGVFEQSIQDFALPSHESLSDRRPRKLVFYGRPESHAKRNLMTIALLAIAKAKRDGAFDAEPWEFYMIGSQRMGETLALEGLTIKSLPNRGYDEYRRVMLDFDVGLCLMYAPHPSVPPFEMVRSGMITVVNTTAARTEDWYRSVSKNFEPGHPTVDGLAAAITRATKRVGDIDGRIAAATTHHPANWSESFAHLPKALGHKIFETSDKESLI